MPQVLERVLVNSATDLAEVQVGSLCYIVCS